MTFLSRFARRFKEIAAVADVRPKAFGSKPAESGQMADVKKPAKSSHNAPVMSKKPPIVDTLPANIKAANEAINALPPVTHPGPMRTSKAGLDLIKSFEDCAEAIGNGQFRAYLCPADVWTIGWGSTRDFQGKPIKPETVWTQDQCDRKKAEDMAAFEREVRAILGDTPVTQGQFDAFVSFAYNIGSDDLRRSTLMRLHKAGNYDAAAKQFLRWNRANGKVLRGLTRRREAEAALYRSGS